MSNKEFATTRKHSCGFSGLHLRSPGVTWLEKVPFVAVEVFEDRDRDVGFLAGRLEEFDVRGLHEAIVVPEIVGVKKKEDATASLIANLLELFRCGRLGQEQAGAARTGRRDHHPALVCGKGRVFDDAETKGFGEEGKSFVIVEDQ